MFACSDTSVNKIKESRLFDYPDFTISEAFDNRKVCSRTEWETFNDERKREVVQYRCYFNGVKDHYEKRVNDQLKRLQELQAKYKAADDSYPTNVAEAEAKIASFSETQGYEKSAYKSHIKELTSNLESRKKLWPKLNEEVSRLETILSDNQAGVMQVYEYYNWVIREDNISNIVAGGIMEMDLMGEPKEWKYSEPTYTIKHVYLNKQENFADYINANYRGPTNRPGLYYDSSILTPY